MFVEWTSNCRQSKVHPGDAVRPAPHYGVIFPDKHTNFMDKESGNSSSTGLHEKCMMKNAVQAVWGLIMKDISAVQEVLTTKACQVFLRCPLNSTGWGCRPRLPQQNDQPKGCTGEEQAILIINEEMYTWIESVPSSSFLCHALLSPPLTRCLIFRGWMHAELMTLMHN